MGSSVAAMNGRACIRGTLRVSLHSLLLCAAVVQGASAWGMKLAVLKEGAQNFEFLRFTLSNVIFTSVTFGGNTKTSTTDVTTTARVETLALRPRQISIQFVPQAADGAPGTPVTSTVDCSGR